MAFAAAIEDHLLSRGGYAKADPANFHRERCLDPTALLLFIQATQPKECAYLKVIQKEQAQTTLLDSLCAALNSEHEGCLKVLRHGLKCFGTLFRVAFFIRPAA